ncbi:MAG: ATP-dependent helicase [Candidatus Nanopelagicales bacterium]|nr:ATP-dependent helicase [Candidatus Nanopelagicales bacterium]
MSELKKPDLDRALGFDLSEEQWAVVSAPMEPAVVVAGAGTGKTTSMAARVAWLVASDYVRADAVLGLTFTNKAAAGLLGSMRSSLSRLEAAGLIDTKSESADEDESAGDPQVLTYHAFAKRIVDEHGVRLGREPSSTLITDGARQQLAYRVVCRTSLPLAAFGKSPVHLTGEVLALDDQLADLAISPQALIEHDLKSIAQFKKYDSLQEIGKKMLATSRLRVALAGLVIEWRAEKLARDVQDYADQTRLALELVTVFPDIAQKVRARVEVVLLDEYQDTSLAQRMLLQGLFGNGHSVTAVGDPCQAIYGFRGASVDNIDSFNKHFSVLRKGVESEPVSYPLTSNRRSGPAILAVANTISADLRERHPGIGALVAGSPERGLGKVQCALFETAGQEQAWIVQEIARLGAGGARGSQIKWGDIAILAATGRDLVDLDTALRAQGVSTQLHGAAGLLRQPAVVEIRSMLEVLHNSIANPALVRILSGPRLRIGVRDLAALGKRAGVLAGGGHRQVTTDVTDALDEAVAGSDPVEAISLSDALADLGDLAAYSTAAVTRFTALAAEITQLRRHVGEPITDLINRILYSTGLSVEIAVTDSAEQQQYAVTSLLDLAAEFTDIDGGHTLGAFLSRLADAERFDVELPVDIVVHDNAVQLLTIHKAKGMEYPHVFVPSVAKGAFPGGDGRGAWPTSATAVPWELRDDVTDDLASFPDPDESPRDKDHKAYQVILRDYQVADDQRLAYVALTRAEYSLTVTGHWWGSTQIKFRGPDPYLTIIRDACIAGAGEVICWHPKPADDAKNPSPDAGTGEYAWPAPIANATKVRLVGDQVRAAMAAPDALLAAPDFDPRLSASEIELIARWDIDAESLLVEARRRRVSIHTVRLPDSLSASALIDALREPAAAAERLARPMPRQPAPAARRGTGFHLWLESRFGQQTLLDPDDLPGSGDHDITSDAQLEELKQAFEKSAYAELQPIAIEEPFSLILGGRVVKGRIDAVFKTGDRYDVIDWKTGSSASIDPYQLALYRQAWSQLRGVPLADIDAGFVMVATGEIIRPEALPSLDFS